MHYFNEFDPYAAQWIRNLIHAGHIAQGEVDERSIVDVSPGDLAGYSQCHFFAGIAGWSLALRLAGWPDDQEVWTGSCPCQPFSAAGKQAGFNDERHLWPHFHRLIRERRPAAVFGEQVASKAVDPWIDLVLTDLEALGYTGGAVAFPSAGVGAPHIRDRTYWMGYANDARPQGHTRHGGAAGRQGPHRPVAAAGVSVRLADTHGRELERLTILRGHECDGEDAGRAQGLGGSTARGEDVGLADAASSGRREERAHDRGQSAGDAAQGHAAGSLDGGDDSGPSPTNGFWRDADWLGCRDGKWRPVEPGTFPLADGIPSRVGRLRAYGNAINPQQAAEFVKAAMECMP